MFYIHFIPIILYNILSGFFIILLDNFPSFFFKKKIVTSEFYHNKLYILIIISMFFNRTHIGMSRFNTFIFIVNHIEIIGNYRNLYKFYENNCFSS